MPSKSPAQARLMAAAAHNPKFAKEVGIPQSVAREFNEADKKKERNPQGCRSVDDEKVTLPLHY